VTRSASGETWSRRSLGLTLLALALVTYSLAVRAVERGAEYPGWDLIGPAHGLYLLSTRPVLDAAREVLASVRGFQYWTSKDSLVYTLIPGGLARLWPWQYWGHLLTLVLFVATLWWTARATGLRTRDRFVLLLAWGASPALLSFAIAGPFLSACLPHALALALVVSPGLRRRPLATLALALAVGELSWHLYLAGRTVFVVFLLAALLERGAAPRTRLAWLAASLVQVGLVLAFSGRVERDMLAVEKLVGHDPVAGVLDLTASLFTELDVPVLWLLGLLSLVFAGGRRLLLTVLLLGQLALLLLLALHGAEKLLTRRFLLVDFYALVSLATAYASATGPRRILRPLIVLGLLGGNLWQLVDLHGFYARSFYERGLQTLPHVQARGDYIAQPDYVEAAEAIRHGIDAGDRVLLLHNLSAYVENTTDPTALLERLYLGLGHERFGRSVLVFGSGACRYDCLPLRPLESAEPELEALRTASEHGPVPRLVLYYPRAERAARAQEENGRVFEAARSRFFVQPLPADAGALRTARLDPSRWSAGELRVRLLEAMYRAQGADRQREAPDLLRFPLDQSWLPDAIGGERYVDRGPFGKHAFTVRWQAQVTACASRSYELLSGHTGAAVVRLDGDEVLRGRDYYFRLSKHELQLAAGPHRLEVEFATWLGMPRLFLDLRPAPGQPWVRPEPGVCGPAAGAAGAELRRGVQSRP